MTTAELEKMFEQRISMMEKSFNDKLDMILSILEKISNGNYDVRVQRLEDRVASLDEKIKNCPGCNGSTNKEVTVEKVKKETIWNVVKFILYLLFACGLGGFIGSKIF